MQLMAGILLSLILTVFHPVFASTADMDTKMQQDILSLINQYRVSHGMSKLKMNDLITKEATIHSQEMAQHKVPFGHDKYPERIKRLFKAFDHPNGGAENVAFNYKTAEIVVNGWLHSPGHLRNIRGNYNLTGIGIARDKQGRIYYTQMFLKA